MLVKQNNKVYQVKFKHKKIQTGKGFQDHLITYLTVLSVNELRKVLRFLSKYARAKTRDEKIKLFKEYKETLFSLETLEEPLIGVLISGLLKSVKNTDDGATDITENTTNTNLSGYTDIIKNKFKKIFGLKTSDQPINITTANLSRSDVANIEELTPEEQQARINASITPTKRGRPPLTPEQKEARRQEREAKKATIGDDTPQQGEGIKDFLKSNLKNLKDKFKNMTPKILQASATILKYFIVYQIGVKIGILKQMDQSLQLMLKDRKTILDISAEIQDKNLVNQILDKIEIRNPRMHQYLTTNII